MKLSKNKEQTQYEKLTRRMKTVAWELKLSSSRKLENRKTENAADKQLAACCKNCTCDFKFVFPGGISMSLKEANFSTNCQGFISKLLKAFYILRKSFNSRISNLILKLQLDFSLHILYDFLTFL